MVFIDQLMLECGNYIETEFQIPTDKKFVHAIVIDTNPDLSKINNNAF